jgi:signal transduction histidine kinase
MKLQRPFFNFSLRAKLTLWIVGLVVLIVVITGIITTLREKKALESEVRNRGLALADDLAKFSASPLLSQDLATLRRFINNTMKQDYVHYVIILDPCGKVVMHSDLEEVGKFYTDSLSTGAINATKSGCAEVKLFKNGEQYCDIVAPITISEARLGTVRLGYSYMAVEKEIVKARQQIVAICLLTILLGSVVAYFLASYIAMPIRTITDAMEQLANDDLKNPLRIARNDEIGTLANSFNKMAEDLGRHRKHLEVLVQARTAELKTANEQLTQEIAERRRTDEELKQSREQLRDLALHLQFVREAERTRIAREIHDELGQALTALKMDTHWLGHRLPDNQKLHDKITSMSKLINTTVQTVRRISTELRPGLLDDFGLSAAIEWQANEFCRRAGIDCDISSEPEDIVLDQARSTALFRIFQEALTNIARHANATRVEITLIKNPASVEMKVRDNGQGITEGQVAASTSFGLMGIRERVHALGGDLKISGAPGKGTIVHVTLPIGAEEHLDDQNTHCG